MQTSLQPLVLSAGLIQTLERASTMKRSTSELSPAASSWRINESTLIPFSRHLTDQTVETVETHLTLRVAAVMCRSTHERTSYDDAAR